VISFTVLGSVGVVLAYAGIAYGIGRLALSFLIEDPDALILSGGVLIGASALTLQLWAYGAVHLPWNAFTLLLPWILAAAIANRRWRACLADDWRRLSKAAKRLPRLDALGIVLSVAGGLIAGTYLINLVTQPLTAWDAIAMWMFKAKLYYHLQSVSVQPIAADVARHLDYPPLFSLMVSSVYTLIGRADDVLGKAINFVFLLAAAGACFALVRTLLDRRMAVMFTFLLVALPLFSPALSETTQMGYADYAFGVCLMISLAHLQKAEISKQAAAYGLAVVFACMAALIKNEGLALLGILLLVFGARAVMRGDWMSIRHANKAVLLALIVALVPVLVWQVYVTVNGLSLATPGSLPALVPLIPDRALVILNAVRRLMTSLNTDYPWLALGFLLASVLLVLNRLRFGTMVYLVLCLQLTSYFIVYLLTTADLRYLLATSLDRVILQVAPSILLMVAISLAPHFKSGSLQESEAASTGSVDAPRRQA
jgi:hypothetical protein